MRVPALLRALAILVMASGSACLDGEAPPKDDDTGSVTPGTETAGLRADGAIVIVRRAR